MSVRIQTEDFDLNSELASMRLAGQLKKQSIGAIVSFVGLVRDMKLNAMGFRVLRFWNNEIIDNFEGALTVILQNLQISTPLPNPLPQGARGL
jgi:Protein of unknown function (DUF559)